MKRRWVCAAVVALALQTSCGSHEESAPAPPKSPHGAAPAPAAPQAPAHGLAGSRPGLERFVVYLDGPAPDLTAYRQAIRDDAAQAGPLADASRRALLAGRATVVTAVGAVGGAVLDVWWMSNAITVEVEPAAVAALRKTPGVARIEGDHQFD